MSAVEIRTAGGDDAPALVALLEQLHPRYPGESDQARELIERILHIPDRNLLVATVEGRVVGTIDLLIVPNITHGGRPWAIAENLIVDDAVRRTGVGKALITETLSRAENDGCYMLQLLSLSHREDAHAFYRRLGFEDVAAGFRLYFDGSAPTRADD